MATLMWIEKVKPFQLDSILPEIGRSLKSILGLTYTPGLSGIECWKPENQLSESYYVQPGSDSFGIMVVGERAMVSVSLPQKYDAICVSPDGYRTNLESALAAAAVIAIGEYSGGQISDHALAYTKVPTQSPKEFAEFFKVDKTFDDINEAAKVFFRARLGLTRRPGKWSKVTFARDLADAVCQRRREPETRMIDRRCFGSSLIFPCHVWAKVLPSACLRARKLSFRVPTWSRAAISLALG